MSARIYKPARNAMQSGVAKTKRWVLEYDADRPREVEPLMGWTSSTDMKQQLRLFFATREEAVAYADKNAIHYRVEEPKPVQRRLSSYSDNFKFNRVQPWTH
ncbi:MAG: ETC complex I subunit [Chelatococcus sp.]|jgi:hypothetical protein|uniref:ETC complex I subunit n=1 Tax=unclassified Chelatococcus TaxID=2638111 RepID=UPI001BCA8105|nr:MULTISPECIES: ETC complex I subunit [unclassified Chelatococcus]CAH1673412.1 ETC complex I subunit-like protein [Hyphomicrobiales bacterium]MBS7738826.1 ETC complex I subunit [Chelatococcus sp. HY11]MBX3539586.1 ETC complex I subunit [Chelatococcus sp.]MBX3547273.1 ETC complex I subunit [Chelatococcus sp.]MCO5076643.1 ETC complex I subunit [Chelatococcus sp.]